MMTDIMIQTKVLVDLIPRTTSVEEEVTNLISELPKGKPGLIVGLSFLDATRIFRRSCRTLTCTGTGL